MDYNSYSEKSLVKLSKTSNYKKHIINNIETINQRKIAILGSGSDVELLESVFVQLRKKNVRVPEVIFHITNDQRLAKTNPKYKFITDIKGMTAQIYVCVVSSFGETERILRGRQEQLASSEDLEKRLRALGFTERDYCIMNKPFGLLSASNAINKLAFDMSENSLKAKAASKAKKTEAKLLTYKDKHKGQRVFILGYKPAKLDEVNVIMNERTISYNGISNLFSRTPQRPQYYLLSEQKHYLGNGKYIEGMECFVTTDVNVFEDKFTKSPVYINNFGSTLVKGLPDLSILNDSYTLKRIDDLYIMLQMAIFMGFSEIYIYGFNNLYSAYINELEEAHITDEGGPYAFPDKAQALLRSVKTYADENNIKIYSMCDKAVFDVFEYVEFANITFNKSRRL